MQIEINEVTCKVEIKKITKTPNLLANVHLTFKGPGNHYFTITGFSLWKSQYSGLNLEPPKKGFFKFVLFEKELKKMIMKEVIKAYDYKDIPVIEGAK